MRREISFGKVDGYGHGRRTCEVTLEVELRENNEGKPVFSVCGNMWNNRHTDVIWGGQCVDDIAKQFEEIRNNGLYMEIMGLWEKYHLNDMHAGTPEQEKAVKELRERNNGRYLNYDEICLHLKWMELYEVELNGESYRYGSAWLYEEIPEKDLRRIKEIIETGR